MQTRRIPRAEWPAFFEGFTREHFGWPTTVWILGPRIGALVEARELPLEEIVADPLAISIHLGGMPGKDVEHPVAAPASVWLETSEEDVLGALGINTSDGTTTLVEFRSPVPPGLAHAVSTANVRPERPSEARSSRQ
jgi:Family of unknown function (DUF5335)